MKPQREVRLERLVDASPEIVEGRVLAFDCPIHRHNEGPLSLAWCRVQIPLKPERSDGWDRAGETFETMTISPSIRCLGGPGGCEWHGFIRDGRFEHCGDSK